MSVIQTDKHLTEELKIAHIKIFVNSYIELTNEFSVATTMLRTKILLGFSLDFFKICFIIYRLLKDKSLNEAIIFWFGEGLVYVLTMCIPLVLMELAFNDLDDINTILADELLIYKDKTLRLIVHDTLDYIETSKCFLWPKFSMNVKFATPPKCETFKNVNDDSLYKDKDIASAWHQYH
ncbi:unnamed protein product [Arctia plantaginis]|uniref:Uncharacterized protein n=1 Tax=Arctia plantaginis TaxID=874455 RepID=A0A8S1A6K9_ARCPL|nr:unnamed protein product [Arctia plantaginis]